MKIVGMEVLQIMVNNTKLTFSKYYVNSQYHFILAKRKIIIDKSSVEKCFKT